MFLRDFLFKALRPNVMSSYSAAKITAIFHSQQVIECKEGKQSTNRFPLAHCVFPYAFPIAVGALSATPGPGPEGF